jgi:hypothetical protein
MGRHTTAYYRDDTEWEGSVDSSTPIIYRQLLDHLRATEAKVEAEDE